MGPRIELKIDILVKNLHGLGDQRLRWNKKLSLINESRILYLVKLQVCYHLDLDDHDPSNVSFLWDRLVSLNMKVIWSECVY